MGEEVLDAVIGHLKLNRKANFFIAKSFVLTVKFDEVAGILEVSELRIVEPKMLPHERILASLQVVDRCLSLLILVLNLRDSRQILLLG